MADQHFGATESNAPDFEDDYDFDHRDEDDADYYDELGDPYNDDEDGYDDYGVIEPSLLNRARWFVYAWFYLTFRGIHAHGFWFDPITRRTRHCMTCQRPGCEPFSVYCEKHSYQDIPF